MIVSKKRQHALKCVTQIYRSTGYLIYLNKSMTAELSNGVRVYQSLFLLLTQLFKVHKVKKLLTVTTIITLLITSAILPSKVYAADIGLTICEYVASDNKNRLRSLLKSNKLKIRKIFKAIRCNKQNLLVFAANSGSVKVGSLIISKLPKKVVKENLTILEGSSQPLFDAGKERVGG